MRAHPFLSTVLLQAVTGAMLALPGSISAVELARGDSARFRDQYDGNILIPGTNVATNPTLIGDVVARATRDFSIPIKTEYRSGATPTFSTHVGAVEDWVVRRADTGMLDFYSSFHDGSFSGYLYRPWDMGVALVIDAEFRDDVVPGGNPPTSLSVTRDGKAVGAVYYASDWGVPNWWTSSSAPILFRSSFMQFNTGPGNLVFGYGTEFSASSGEVAMSFFMPTVPEQSSVLLLGFGLLTLCVRLNGRKNTAVAH